MKKTIALVLVPALFIALLGVTSCKNRSSNEEQKQIDMDQVQMVQGEIAANVYPLPSSAEVINMLTDYEIGYIIGIANPTSNASKYISSSSRALNLGVYGGDLSYATLYNMQQEVINYLDAIRSLANELNMSQIYDETLYDKIKDNYDNKDELVSILTTAFDDTYTFLSDNDQQVLALLVVGGAWVEGMYLTTHVSESAYQLPGISKNLLEQKDSFEVLIELSQPYSSDPIMADFLQKVEPIKAVYSGLGTSLTEQNIMDITVAIEAVREQIVQ
jgi:hypothetical protein